MKKQQKRQHQPPSRKSVGLSSSSSAHLSGKANPESGTRLEDAWSLSLHVVEQQPLQIRYPYEEEEDVPIRRSSRFTINQYKTPPPERITSKSRSKKLLALVASELRRSPRFSSALALTLTDGINVGSEAEPKKRRRLSEDREAPGGIGKKGKAGCTDGSLRRSSRLSGGENGNSSLQLLPLPEPGSKSGCKGSFSERRLRWRTVFMHVGDEKGKSQKTNTKKNYGDFSVKGKRSSIIKCSEKRALERDVTVKSLKSRNVKMQHWKEKEKAKSGPDDCALIELPHEMLALPESGKCLRSRSVEVQLQEERVKVGSSVKSAKRKCLETPETECFPEVFNKVSEKRDMEECDSEGLSENSLRSRKIECNVGANENAEKTDNLIGDRHSFLKSKCNVESIKKSERKEKGIICCFVGDPIPEEVAQKRWQWRYDLKSRKKGKSWKLNADEEDEIILNVDCHYAQAKVGSFVLDIGDCVFVKGEGKEKHLGRILEFFKTTDGHDYFRVQWFFRAQDTVLKDAASSHDKRRLFYSMITNDNILDCIISKVNVVKLPASLCVKPNSAHSAAFYYDMEYCVDYSTFRTLRTETSPESQSFLLNPKRTDEEPVTLTPMEVLPNYDSSKKELALLDLYAGCGGMSTGLCLGAKLSGVNLVTRWAVDYNSSACDSLKLNHPETKVRNGSAEDFLELLRQWENLCKLYISDIERTLKCEFVDPPEPEAVCSISQSDTEVSTEVYEVSSLVDICYGDPNEGGKCELHFKVRWKGYGPDEDTWEPFEGLSNCQDCVEEFVRKGFNSKILPLPSDVDVICGGPPCQGISGYNRFRNFDSPLADERNRQIVVFMDIVEFLKPRYVLMENVVDIIRFDKGSLGRYALSRLVLMKYQARLGTMASGCYGLPQFRLRVFIWGAHPTEMLPPFPLPTHDVVVKYWPPPEFERNVVGYDEGQPRMLEDVIVLRDSISDLPAVGNDETREEMAYEKPPETELQKHIRLPKDEMMGLKLTVGSRSESQVLYDHRPLKLSEHDYLRVCQVPHRKGANFRDLPGIIVGDGNVARRDPTQGLVMLPTGRPLVPDCVLSFENGKSRKPYGRVWWDETVSTVVTFPHVRAQAILHPEQDRLLTIRECARLQGFPDYYRFCGTTKERYCQIGNAVSIPVARALGYALGMAYRKAIGDEALMRLPPRFSLQLPWVDEAVVFGS